MFLIAFLAAVTSTTLFLTLVWWLDKYEKEPWGLFLAAFAYGCVPAVILAVIVELILDIPLAGMGAAGEVISAGVVAPIVEEGIKGLAVLLIFFIWRREFDGVLDGIVYGAVVGLGFAMIENILYFLEPDPAVIVMRTLPFGLNHAFFTAFTGTGLGLARLAKRRWSWVLYFPLFVTIGTGFHATHNFLVTLFAGAGCLVALVTNWIGVTVILVIALVAGRHEKRWIQQELQDEVAAGVLAEADYEALQRLSRRIGARLWMWRHHGWRAFRLLGKFFNGATELAFRKHHLRAGTAHKPQPGKVDTLRQEIMETRGALLSIMGAK